MKKMCVAADWEFVFPLFAVTTLIKHNIIITSGNSCMLKP
jgi:hypothetical protein